MDGSNGSLGDKDEKDVHTHKWIPKRAQEAVVTEIEIPDSLKFTFEVI